MLFRCKLSIKVPTNRVLVGTSCVKGLFCAYRYLPPNIVKNIYDLNKICLKNKATILDLHGHFYSFAVIALYISRAASALVMG